MSAKQGVSAGTAIVVIVIVVVVIAAVFWFGLREKPATQSPAAQGFLGISGGKGQAGMKPVGKGPAADKGTPLTANQPAGATNAPAADNAPAATNAPASNP